MARIVENTGILTPCPSTSECRVPAAHAAVDKSTALSYNTEGTEQQTKPVHTADSVGGGPLKVRQLELVLQSFPTDPTIPRLNNAENAKLCCQVQGLGMPAMQQQACRSWFKSYDAIPDAKFADNKSSLNFVLDPDMVGFESYSPRAPSAAARLLRESKKPRKKLLASANRMRNPFL
jgi:hypothetical protein